MRAVDAYEVQTVPEGIGLTESSPNGKGVKKMTDCGSRKRNFTMVPSSVTQLMRSDGMR